MHSLEPRSLEILKAIVAEYISTGEPVGSRTISKKRDVELSAASIRNVMSDLTEAGYITQPHISAGRIPTDIGYRFFVNTILQDARPEPHDYLINIESLITSAGVDVKDVLRQSSLVLAELSHKAGVVTSTALSEQTFRSIELIKVATDKIVVVLVSTTGFVQNKMIFDEDGLNQEILESYARVLNEMLKNLDLRQAKERIEQELAKEKTLMDAMLSKALRLGHIVLSQETERDIFIEGRTNILDEPEFSDLEQLRALLVTLEEKSKLLKILDKTLEARGLQVFIGSEHGLDQIESCSIIAYPVRTTEYLWASIGVIGPKRMDYQKVVPLVMSTGKVLTRLLRQEIETTQ
jgi:heat-inducible transcriptional repressor